MVKTHFTKYKENLQRATNSTLNEAQNNITEKLQTAVTEEIRKMEHIMNKKAATFENTINQLWMRSFKMFIWQ
jgi:hypothetical protein